MISCENAGKVTIEGKFPCAIYRKGVVINSILCHFAGAGCIKDILVLEV